MKKFPNLAALWFLAWSAVPSFAQAPPPVSALPDTERRTAYTISGTTCACSLGFQLYASGSDVDAWIEVWISGVRYLSTDGTFGWTLSSGTGPLATIPRPITDAVLTFNQVQTGAVQIVGAERPRRLTQFQENRGVAARDLNQAISDLVAIERELWDKTNDVTGRAILAQPGENLSVLQSAANRANTTLGFNLSGQLALFPPGSGGTCPPLFTAVAAGCVPASGGGTANFLRADGTWATPAPVAISPPQGRLTLTSGVAAPTSDVAATTTLYYTPAVGAGFVPITADGLTFSMVQFAQVAQLTTDATKSPAAAIANANYDIFCWQDTGPTNRCTRGPYWTAACSPTTITIASPAVVTCGGSALNINYNPPIVFTTTGALPTGLTAGTTYYVVGSSVSATTFNVSATPGGAAINTSGSQSGTHTGTYGDDFGVSYRSGTTSLTAVTGTLLNTNTITNGPAALRGTYVGTVRTDASALLNMTFGTTSAGGGPALLNVYNLYNQIETVAIVGDNTASWSFTNATRMMDNSAGNRVSLVKGFASEGIDVVRGGYMVPAAATSSQSATGYALDKVAALDRFCQIVTQSAVQAPLTCPTPGKYKPQVGAHFIQATELADATHTTTFTGQANFQFLEVSTWQ